VIGEGRIPEIRALRKGDEFSELLEQLQKTVAQLEERTKAEIEALSKATDAIDGSRPEAAKEQLAGLLAAKQAMLEHQG
jgi:hypothetical protein